MLLKAPLINVVVKMILDFLTKNNYLFLLSMFILGAVNCAVTTKKL